MSVIASLRSRLQAMLAPVSSAASPRAWWPIVREPYAGAWAKNDEVRGETLLTNPAVFACISRISQDISKLPVDLVTQTAPGVWQTTANPAYSPVLRHPNHYQTTTRFVEQWVTSKLTWGNAYALKRRDGRGVVDGLFLMQPPDVVPLVAPDGAVYYELRRPDVDLSGLWPVGNTGSVVLPAREVIHDRWNCFFHPLVGLSPLYAAAFAAQQGTTMQRTATEFFAGGSQPTGVLIAPGKLSPDQASRMRAQWAERPPGSVAILEEGLKYEALSSNSVDSQFIEQLQWTVEQIAMVYGVPLFLLNSNKGAAYANNEPLIQLYHDECLQPLISSLEEGLEEGLEMAPPLGVELDIDDLIWMQTDTRTKAANETVRGGILSPNEARQKYFSLPGVKGGDSPMMQQQQFSLSALAERDAADPFSKPAAPLPPAPDQGERPDRAE